MRALHYTARLTHLHASDHLRIHPNQPHSKCNVNMRPSPQHRTPMTAAPGASLPNAPYRPTSAVLPVATKSRVSRQSPSWGRDWGLHSTLSVVCCPISRFRLTADLSGRADMHSMRDLTGSQCRSAAEPGVCCKTYIACANVA